MRAIVTEILFENKEYRQQTQVLRYLLYLISIKEQVYILLWVGMKLKENHSSRSFSVRLH